MKGYQQLYTDHPIGGLIFAIFIAAFITGSAVWIEMVTKRAVDI